MFNLTAWAARAKGFIRSLAQLPGNINLSDSIEPAATHEFTLERLAAKGSALPPEISRFVREASGRCALWYQWTPPIAWGRALHDSWRPGEKIIGGADFCEAAKYCLDDYENVLPLAPLENNYQLALELHADERRRGVVYMPTFGDGPRHRISMNFFQFLQDWERVCYLTPCCEMLRPWLDPATGLLQPSDQQAKQLRAFFTGGSPVCSG